MPWAPDYVTPEELADYVRTDVESDRLELTSACAAASRAVDLATYRQFGQTAAEARIYTPKWSPKLGMWVVECDDCFATPTAVAIDTAGDGTFSTTIDPADVVMRPVNNAVKGRPFERMAIRRGVSVFSPLGADSVRLTNVWGWSVGVPETVHLASRLQASRFFARRNSPYGVAGSPDQGSEIRLQSRADPDVKLMLKDYRRDVWLS